MKYTVVVVLENGTVGITEKKVEIGQVVKVLLQDENGNYIEDTGKVEEILINAFSFNHLQKSPCF